MFIDSFNTDTGTLNTTSESGNSSGNQTASSVTFDNTDTGLEAANVQDAIEEVNGKLDSLIIGNCKIRTVKTLSTGNFEFYIDIAKNGYTPLAIVGWNTWNRDIGAVFHLTGMQILTEDNTVVFYGKCTDSVSIDKNACVDILYVKKS